jgi:hypothetical protein
MCSRPRRRRRILQEMKSNSKNLQSRSYLDQFPLVFKRVHASLIACFISAVLLPIDSHGQTVSTLSLPGIPELDASSVLAPALDSSCIRDAKNTNDLKKCIANIIEFKRRHDTNKARLDSYCKSLDRIDSQVRQRPSRYGLSGLSDEYTAWAQQIRLQLSTICASRSPIRVSHTRAIESYQRAMSISRKKLDKFKALEDAYKDSNNPTT